MVPLAEGTLLHYVVEDFTRDDAVVASDPHGSKRSQRHTEPSGGVVHQSPGFKGTNAFPFRHNTTKSSRAVVPSPHVFHRGIVACDMSVGWHDSSSLTG